MLTLAFHSSVSNEVPHKCTVGDQNGSFASINAYKGVALTADVLCLVQLLGK